MKKLLIAFMFMFTCLVASDAYALTCKKGQLNQADECWTWVRLAADETDVVSVGTLVVYDITNDTALENAYVVEMNDASADTHLVAGVLQQIIASGDGGYALVRGHGQLVVAGPVTTGDRLYVSATDGQAGTSPYEAGGIASGDVIGFALETSTAANATIDAYITII